MAWQRTVSAAALVLAASASAISGQIIRYDPRGGQIGSSYQGVWRELATGASFNSRYLSEWIELPFSGVLSNPRIFHYSLRLSPVFSQQRVSNYETDFRTRNIFVNFAGTLFQAGRTPISLTATRNSGRWRGGFTSDRDFTQVFMQAAAWYNNRWLPARLAVGRRSSQSTWRSNGGPPIRQDERVRGVRATASNRKLALRFERQSFEDRIFDRTYTTEERSAQHTLRWGKGSRLASTLESFSREGYAGYTRSLWTERLHIQHTAGASSDLLYTRRRSQSDRGMIRGQDYGANSQARVRWFHLALGANAGTLEFEGGRSKRQTLVPTVGVSLPLPGGGVLTASGFNGIETLSIEATANGIIDVLDERHEVPDLRSFFLDQRFIDAATVVVRSDDHTIEYLVDRDYRLIDAGSLVRVVIPAGSRIQVGDVLMISYRHRLIGEGTERANKAGYRTMFRLGGFSVRRFEQKRSVENNGDNGIGLFDTYEALTAVAMHQATPVGRFLFEASRSKRNGPSYADVTDEARASHSAALGPAVRTSLTASASRSRSDNQSEITSVFGSGGITVRFLPTLGMQAQVDAWRFRQDGTLIEGTMVASLNVDWRFGSVETDWRYEHIRRENGSFGAENRLWARVVRRF